MFEQLHNKCKQCEHSTNDFYMGIWCKELASIKKCKLTDSEIDFLNYQLIEVGIFNN